MKIRVCPPVPVYYIYTYLHSYYHIDLQVKLKLQCLLNRMGSFNSHSHRSFTGKMHLQVLQKY